MSDAKRYDVTEKYIGTGEYVGAMEESATGDWVAFSDYDQLKARLAEAEALLRDRACMIVPDQDWQDRRDLMLAAADSAGEEHGSNN